MRIDDLRTLPAGSPLQTDLCIVGSGPAALTLASEFAHTSRQVLVLESGSRGEETSFALAQNEIESVGAPRELDQSKVRNRVLGGASHTWSGRCTTFDALDYEARPWVPGSGWPVTAQTMAAFEQRAAQYLGIAPAVYDDRLLAETGLPPRFRERDGGPLRNVFWQFSRHSPSNRDHLRHGARFEETDAPNIQLLTHATVTHITTDPSGGTVRELEVATPEGVRHTVRARTVVLCAGGIENARLLLASNRVDPRGVGNGRDLVGRYLMDHPRAVLGTFAPAAARALTREFFILHHRSGYRMQRGLSLSAVAQRKERLLNCAAWITQHFAHDDAWHALRTARLSGSRRHLARVAIRHSGQIAHGAWSRFVRKGPLPRRVSGLDLDVLLEQTPDRDSRVTLSDRKDPLGMPLSRIDWRIGDRERRTAIRLGCAIHEAFGQAGLPQPHLPEDARFRDVAHPTGTTRMAATPEHGVVDPDCRVWGVDNLYVAGSSVFPTAGHANPTLMIVALTLRLADTLRAGR